MAAIGSIIALGSILAGILSAGAALTDTGVNANQQTINREFTHEQNKLTRSFNSQEAQLSREFNALEAQKQRDFERDLSNTAVARRMVDLQKSGINPLLAGSSEASTPVGSAGSASGASATFSGYQSGNISHLGASGIGSYVSQGTTALARHMDNAEYREWLSQHKDVDNFLKEVQLVNEFKKSEESHLAHLIDTKKGSAGFTGHFNNAVDKRINDTKKDITKINDYIRGMFVK